MKKLQSKSTIIQIVKTLMIFIIAAVGAAAQTNTFPSSGDVGIGTTAPLVKTHIVGSLYVPANETDTIFSGAVSGNTSSSLIGPNGYWAIRSGTAHGFNLDVFNGGAPRAALTVWQSGNVGIGASSPFVDSGSGVGTVFTVGGTSTNVSEINIGANVNSANGSLGSLDFFNSNLGTTEKRNALINAANDGATNSGNVQFWTANAGALAEKMRIDKSGNVGIGTTTPGQKLQVVGGKFGVFNSSTTGGATIDGDAQAGATSIYSDYLSGAEPKLHLSTYSGRASASGITLDTSGNVGIGTTSPGYKLDVNGEINATGFRINGTPISAGGSSQWTGTNSIYYDGGNVGIGTPNPGSRLHVSSGLNAEIRITDTTTGNPYLSFYDGSTPKGYIQYSAGTMDFYAPTGVAARIVTNSAERIRIDTAGNVGIGKPDPQYKLDVNGSINSNATITGNNIVAKYQDVAEWVPAVAQLPTGTVVVLDSTKSNHVTQSTVAYDTRVAGVISAQPGIALGESGANKVLVATTGRVLVQVDATNSPIHIGDLLVTSDTPGLAMKSEPIKVGGRLMHMPGTLIGKALEPLEKGSGKILVLLSLQ